jgi:hypothetical protein
MLEMSVSTEEIPERPSRRRGLVEQIIEHELHTDQPAAEAVGRVTALLAEDRDQDTAGAVAMPLMTGALHTSEQPDWKYGVNRETTVPLRCGVNYSYNALARGTGVDERALPKWMQSRLAGDTEKVLKQRREYARARADGEQDPRSKAFDEAVGYHREQPARRGRRP